MRRAPSGFRTSSGYGAGEFLRDGRHRFEHWYRDNTVYFITARCRDRYPAFATDKAKSIFWDRLAHCTTKARFQPWVVSLIDNHYHILGYNESAEEFGEMMRCLHGSTAKLVNDLLPERRVPFWRGEHDHDYFDGCLRDEMQLRITYRYVLLQAARHGLCNDWREYLHTRVWLTLEECLRFAGEHKAYMQGVRYQRYEG
jgi:hypothetical protein